MAGQTEILELIEEAAAKGQTSLDLSFNQLTSVPTEISKLTNLTNLDLSGNQLTSLPHEIGKLTGLRELNLASNILIELPLEIGNLVNLELLNLGLNITLAIKDKYRGNRLTELPQVISSLTKLKDLDLEGNQLTHLGQEIRRLFNLQFLNLGSNELSHLPRELADLTNLKYLGLDKNNLTHLSKDISRLTNLETLDLSGNQLTSLPTEISKLTNLTNLDLSDNQLTGLPTEITKLTNLTNLDLSGNQLTIAPEVLRNPHNVKAIFAAIAGLKTGQPLNEAKMLIVGDGKVGKSSIVERLTHNTFNPKKETTLGVEINDEMKISLGLVEGAGEPIKLNIWDFGGQEIQHSTHQFFLTTRSLYLLVVDARKGDQISGIEYWLKLIGSFGGDSPILIVINQIDQLKGQRALNLDRKALGEKYNIRDFIETSCETGEGIPALKAAIAREVERLPHVRDIWPREWFNIKQRLREMKEDYIPVEKYLEICREEDLDDADLREFLLGRLHELGTIIRFPGDTQVLNPRWVTQGVYGLLTSAQLVKEQGQFDLRDVGKILDSLSETRGRYPSHTHRRLIDVMKHFELCFEFTDRPGHYLIPRHLHDNELDIPWEDDDALKFQYHYEVLPDSVISRFIVRMNQYITKQFYWKNGVFLHSGKDDRNRARIKADLVDRKIFISITGKEQTRRAFLAVIRAAFDEINSNFKIEIKSMIPAPGHPQVLVSYKDLLVHEEMNEPVILIPELRQKFNVRTLLDGVEEIRDRMERRERNYEERRFNPRMPKKNKPQPQRSSSTAKNNPWLSGSFYLFAYVVVFATIVLAVIVLNKYGVSLTTAAILPVVLIGGFLGIGILGANQLKNDERLADESYVKLMIESYKRLPLLRNKDSSTKAIEKE